MSVSVCVHAIIIIRTSGQLNSTNFCWPINSFLTTDRWSLSRRPLSKTVRRKKETLQALMRAVRPQGPLFLFFLLLLLGGSLGSVWQGRLTVKKIGLSQLLENWDCKNICASLIITASKQTHSLSLSFSLITTRLYSVGSIWNISKPVFVCVVASLSRNTTKSSKVESAVVIKKHASSVTATEAIQLEQRTAALALKSSNPD